MTTIEWATGKRAKAHKEYDRKPSEESYRAWQRWKEVVEALKEVKK